MVLVDIPYIGSRLGADLLRDDQFDIVEPFVRIELTLRRLAAHAGDVARPGVVAGECEQRAVAFAEMGIREVVRHQAVHVFGAGVDVGLDVVDVAAMCRIDGCSP
jgi:hypothetical protein